MGILIFVTAMVQCLLFQVFEIASIKPNLLLIEGVKGGRPRMSVEPPLIVYREPGVYTEEVW